MAETGTVLSRFRVELVAQLLSGLSGALLMVLLTRLLSPDAYGTLFLAISIFGTLMVFSRLGIAKSASRYVAEYKEMDPSQIPHIVRASLLYNLVTIVGVSVSLLLAHEFLAGLLGEEMLVRYLEVGALYLVFGSLTKYVRILLQGFEDIQRAAYVLILNRASRLVLAVGFVLLGHGALGALAGYILGFVLASAFGFAILYMEHYRDYATGTIQPGLRRKIAEYTFPLTATNTADVLDRRIDTVLVGFFLTPAAVSSYVISKQIMTFLEKPMSALGFTLSPTFGSEKAADNIDHARELYEVSLTNSLLLYVPMATGLALVAAPLVEIVFGADYLGAVPVIQVMSVYAILRTVTKLTSNGIDFLGRARDRAIVKAVTALMNVVLNVLLLPTAGVVGAAIATVVTYGIYTATNFYIIHLEFDLDLRRLLRDVSLVLFVSGAMAAIVYPLLPYIDGLTSLLLVVLAGGTVWMGGAIGTGLVDPHEAKSVIVG